MTALHSDQPVICAYEDKAIARHALRASAWLADALDRPLLIAHVFDPMAIRVLSTRDMLEQSITDEEVERAARARAHRQLLAAAALCGEEGREVQLIEDEPVPGLLTLAAGRDARLLVTGTAARVGLDRLLLGSVASELAARAPCPVIAVPRAAALEEPGPVVVGYDGSEHGLRAARHAAALAAQLDRDLVVVEVTKDRDTDVRADRELAGELYLTATGGRLGGPVGPFDLDVSVVREPGDPADVLIRVAREQAAALIIIGTRGRNVLSSALLGSVGASVMTATDRPVGLVPPTARDA